MAIRTRRIPGVPPGTQLRSSGSITVEAPGATIENRDIDGGITVAADNVTIENSRITATGGIGAAAVVIENGVTGTTIRRSTIQGAGENGDNAIESAVFNHNNEADTVSLRNEFFNCSNCWEGSGTIRDTYMLVNATIDDAHYEPIYVCGGKLVVDHNTLINVHPQTATVFGDTICGANDFTVTDSLLAGGGYLVYPAANSESEGANRMKVSGNRFARCGTSEVYDSESGGRDCSGGPDADGYFPNGGYFGVAAHYYTGSGQTWTNNVWNDNQQVVCPDGDDPGFIVPMSKKQMKRQRRWERREEQGLNVPDVSPRKATRTARMRCWATDKTHPVA